MKLFLSIFILFLFATFGFSQKKNKKPDLSGTWQLVQSENVSNKNLPDKEKSETSKILLEITYTEPKLIIVRIWNENKIEKKSEDVYYSDERGETNSTYDNETEVTVSKWNGKEFTIVQTEMMTPPGLNPGVKDMKIKKVQRLKLSKDGKTLTFIYDFIAPPGIPVQNAAGGRPKQIYTRTK